MKKNVKLKIKLPKVPDIELVALEGLNIMGNYLGIPDDKIGEAKILVTETVINGLEHSGDNNPQVVVEFSMTKEKLIILVKDSGKGDTLLLMSDGFAELKNSQNELYGYVRIKEIFRSLVQKSSSEIIKELKTTASQWTNEAEPDDDITFVVIKFL